MAALTLRRESYRDRILGGWTGRSAGITLGAPLRGQLIPGHLQFYQPVPGQPAASLATDFPLVWLTALEECGPDIAPADLAIAWLEHLDYQQDELGYAALNLRRGLPPPASGAHANWFHNGTAGIMRADFWAMAAPGNPQAAAALAYHDAKLDHSEEGLWAAMFVAAMGSASFFLDDTFTLLTIGLAMMPRTCRTARAVKTALAAAQRGASWLEARESVQHEAGSANFSDAPQNMGFLTIGLLYGGREFGPSLCAAVNCGCDSEAVGCAIGAILGFQRGRKRLPEEWVRPIGDLVIPGAGLRDLKAPGSLSEVAERMARVGESMVARFCPLVELTDAPEPSQTLLPSGAPPPDLSPASPQASPQAESDIIPTGIGAESIAASPDENPDAPARPLPDLQASPQTEGEIIPTGIGAEQIAPLPADGPDAPARVLQAGSAPIAQPPAESTGAAEATEPDAAPSAPSDGGPARLDAAAPAAPMPGFAPQPAAIPDEKSSPRAVDLPAQPAAAESFPAAAPEPDPLTAIAWADSTLVKPLLVTPPNALLGQAGPFDVVLDTGGSPTIEFNAPRVLGVTVTNRSGQAFSGRIQLLAPAGWRVAAPPNLGQRQFIAANTGALQMDWTVSVPENEGRIEIANTVIVRFTPEEGAPFQADFVLMSPTCWWCVGPFANFDGEGFDHAYAPESKPGLQERYVTRIANAGQWERLTALEPTVDLEPIFRASSGVCYGQARLRCPAAREARLVANTNGGVKVWLNGQLVLRRFHRETFRPQIGTGPWAVDISLAAGDNVVLVKWIRSSEPYQFSLSVSDRAGRGIPEVGATSW